MSRRGSRTRTFAGVAPNGLPLRGETAADTLRGVEAPDTRNPELVAFAERLNAAWKAAGYPSRSAAATAAGKTGGYFARLCAGTVEPGITIVAGLATAFGVSKGYLAFGEESSTEPKGKKGKR